METQQKRGNIEGGLLTEDFLESSKSVTQKAYGKGAMKGAQQWFTPYPLASFIHRVLSPVDAVLDISAGNGALLKPYQEMARFGVEIDNDHAKNGPYRAINGDAQRVVPMIRAAGLNFDRVALNPPFGLMWEDPKYGRLNSSVLAYLWGESILESFGQGAIIMGRDRLAKELLPRPEAKGIYAVIELTDLDDWGLPTVVAFFVKTTNRSTLRGAPHEFYEDTISMEEIGHPRHHRSIINYRDEQTRHISSYARVDLLQHQWDMVRKEFERRQKERSDERAKHRHDIVLKGSKIGIHLSAFARLSLNNVYKHREIELLDGQAVPYFGTNPKAWKQVQEAEAEGWVTVDPALKERVAEEIKKAEVYATPLFPLPEQMRMGWLSDQEKITCKKTDEDRGFWEGEEYSLTTQTPVITSKEQRTYTKKGGEPGLRWFETERRVLQVVVGDRPSNYWDYRRNKEATPGYATFNESKEDIEYLIEHFELPDPGDVYSKQRAVYDRNVRVLESIEEDFGFTLKRFQKDHLARLLVKGRGMLAHEQGLGKTLMLMTLAEAQHRLGATNQALFVIPQDLHDQWAREAKKFFGRTIERINSIAKAREVGQRMKNQEEGWFITHYEALSTVGPVKGRKPERLEHSLVDSAWGIPTSNRKGDIIDRDPKRHTRRNELHRRLAEYKANKREEAFDPILGTTTLDACPACNTDTSYGWKGGFCGRCGYSDRKLLVKRGYSHLTTAFKKGVVCVDEISEIRGDDSLRSKAIRALSAGPHKYGGTGTPLSNYINDSFWGLWFCLGNASPTFPYDYKEGKAKFESDFCVIEHMMGDPDKYEEHKRARKKVLPQITNVSQFWRLTQPGVSRCRKEDTGEPIVDKIIHPVRVPMGIEQLKMHKFWMSKSNFADYFTYMYPDHSLVKYNLVEQWAGALGQKWRLESAATLPAEDGPTNTWEGASHLEGITNWTPAMLKVLEIAIERVEAGDKVLIGSDLILTGKWIAERLCEKGIRAVHITEEKAGKIGTKNPRARAKEVTEFVEGNAQVLCAGVAAMKLGHNLDKASSVIVHGLPYSHYAQDQFVARVHRLTSKRPVNVYVVIPRDSITQSKWDLLKDKGGSSDLAFDGHLIFQQEKAVDWNEVLDEMRKRGVRAQGDEMHEEDVQEQWENIPMVEMPVIETVAPLVEDDEEEDFDMLEMKPFEFAEYLTDEGDLALF